MCGITGVFAFNLVGKFSKINVAAATRSLDRRGPDFQDIYVDEWVCLGHRRLSIIDTREIAHQPMWDLSGRYAIIFNGEIFNHQEIRTELEGEQFRFLTHCDTEVILHAFQRWGSACFSRMRGMFAIAVWVKIENQ